MVPLSTRIIDTLYHVTWRSRLATRLVDATDAALLRLSSRHREFRRFEDEWAAAEARRVVEEHRAKWGETCPPDRRCGCVTLDELRARLEGSDG